MSESVYTKIGGYKTVEAVVEDFYTMVLNDDQLVEYFDDHDMESLYAHQVQFISSVAGGPAQYTGSNMREAHAHLDIDQSDFGTVAEYLEKALLKNGVNSEHIGAIMMEVSSLEGPILDR